jgi:hypothetical protein
MYRYPTFRGGHYMGNTVRGVSEYIHTSCSTGFHGKNRHYLANGPIKFAKHSGWNFQKSMEDIPRITLTLVQSTMYTAMVQYNWMKKKTQHLVYYSGETLRKCNMLTTQLSDTSASKFARRFPIDVALIHLLHSPYVSNRFHRIDRIV